MNFISSEIVLNHTEKNVSAPSFSPPLTAKRYCWAFLSTVLITVIGKMIAPSLDISNVTLLYLLPVLVSAVRWGRGPSLFACFLGALFLDSFFVPPTPGFAASDVRYLFCFAIFLVVALVTSAITSRLRNLLEKTEQREKRTLALYAFSQSMAAEADPQKLLKAFVERAAEALGGHVSILIPDGDDHILRKAASHPHRDTFPDQKEQAVAHWVLAHGQRAGKGTETLSRAGELTVPVKMQDKTLATLVITLDSAEELLPSEQEQFIEAFANLAAVAIVRVKLAQDAEQVKWLAEAERLHRALLNSISHDLRTPLASITGAVTGLLTDGNVYDGEATKMLLDTIKEGSLRMNRFVGNLLDMTRLQSGILQLKKQWCDVQDIVGVALRELHDILQERVLCIDIPSALPPVKADFALLEHVMINLLENAAKHAPADSEIGISARFVDKAMLVSVEDHGLPIPGWERQHVFDKFYRSQHSSHSGGVGLGLPICKGIVEAHGGMIWVDSSIEHGNRFTFSLPALEQPSEPPEPETGGAHAIQ